MDSKTKRKKRQKDLDVDSHGTSPVQRGPIEANFNEHGHSGRILPPVIGLYGGTPTDFSLILDLVARELALNQIPYFNVDLSEAK